MTFKQSLAVVLVSAVTSVAGVVGYAKYQEHQSLTDGITTTAKLPARFAANSAGSNSPFVDFEMAATKAAPAVVHIRTLTKSKQVAGAPNMRNNPFKEFFGDDFGDMFGSPRGGMQSPEQRASGSGVIISNDGYVVTNNHVVDGADELKVTLNDRKDYTAKVVGKDPSTDLAVLKIEGKDLPYLQFANSDDVHLGQWVLAIGYPLNLETTVTSGIVSAKSRSLGINSRQSKTPIESFIQTDAAVNPGNSGGALVNTDGNLIGINSAIASPTGSYAGYSYAIPSNLVQKVVTDIIKYGAAQRAYLGVMYGADQMSAEDRKKNNIPNGDGVYVMEVAKGSAAEAAGIQKGDFINKINGADVRTGTQMVEKIATMRPGDKVTIGFNHNGSQQEATVALKNASGTYESVQEQVVDQLGATFDNLDKDMAAQLNIPSGVVVKSLGNGILTEQTRIREGFIITKVNDTRVSNVEQLKALIKHAGNSAVISGVYPSQPGVEYRYALNDLR